MNHLENLGDSISIPIPPDEDGFTGRECPNPDCEGYFKVEFGTGLQGDDLPCHCPYCGHEESHNHFWTKEQIEYAQSIVLRKVNDALYKDLKKFEFEHKPSGSFGIGFSFKVEPGKPTPIHYYRENRLETEIVCSKCTLRYSVYGVFAFCPDCGQHNSLQIFNKNLEVVGKMLDISATVQDEISKRLIENALEDCVSAFDGFGRELCRVFSKKSFDPTRVEKVSFQNLDIAKNNILNLFNIDLTSGINLDEWEFLIRCFQKRHVLSHRMGVIDNNYIHKTGDTEAIVGRKVAIEEDEVRRLMQILSNTTQKLSEEFQHLP